MRPWGYGLALSLLCLSPIAAQAQEGMSEAEAVQMLGSDNPDVVRLGIETLGLSGTPSAAVAIGDRVVRGLPPELLDVAMTTLRVLGRPETVPVLTTLCHHRRVSVRARAYEPLAATRAPAAVAVLVDGLSDVDATVRGAAANGLAEIGTREQMPALLRAFDRGVAEAAPAIGKLGGPDDIRRLLGALGRLPLSSLAPGLSNALIRTDLPQRLRLDVVGRLQELGTAEVRAYLEQLLVLLPNVPNDPVRRAIEEAIVGIAG